MSVRTLRIPAAGLTLAAAARLERDARELREDRSVRAAILVGEGEDFCAGAAGDWDPLDSGLDPAAALAAIRAPTLAALHGRVAGVGLELALACDLRLATPDAVLSLPTVAAGRLPCWGGVQRLVRLAGLPTALAVLYGEELTADRAAGVGLVQLPVPADDLEAATERTVAQLLSLAPLALELVKEGVYRGSEMSMRAGLELEGDLNHLLQSTADRREGLAAFVEKREPDFKGE
jgi:enoyl-CoA hydratase/carnithine racemase